MTELTKEALTDAIRSAAVKAASTDERRVLSYAAGEIERQSNEIERLKSDIRELTEAMNRARRTAKELGEENHALRNPASTEKITAQLEELKYTRAEPNGWTCKTLAHGRVTDDVAESWNGAIDAAILTIADWDVLCQAQQEPVITDSELASGPRGQIFIRKPTPSPEVPEETGSSLQLRNLIRQRHAAWSQALFGDVGPVGPLRHLSKEALEAAAEPEDLSEWADMQFLLWDAQRRAGICDGEITAAMEEKLKVNMARQWPEPKDGEPRLHIKEAGADHSEHPIELVEIPVERDESGYWSHPAWSALFGEREGMPRDELNALLAQKNLEYTYIELEYDSDNKDAAAHYFIDGSCNVSTWKPTRPDGDGWFIASIHDTDDGPVCFWVRPIPQIEGDKA